MNKVSYIIPIFNSEDSLEKCIDSIMNQAGDKEIILIDDGSSDKSPEIEAEYAEKYSFIRVFKQEHQGAAEARNIGIINACSEWICFVDSDDYLIYNSMDKIFDEVDCNNVDFIITGYLKEREGNVISYNYSGTTIYFDEEAIRKLIHANLNKCKCPNNLQIYTPWAKIYRREFLLSNNVFFTPGVRKSHDVLFNCGVLCNAKASVYVPTVTYVYSYNEASLCNRYLDGVIEDYKKQQDVIWNFVKEQGEEEFKPDFYVRCIVNFLFLIQLDYVHTDNKKKYKDRRREFIQGRNLDVYVSAFESVDMKSFSIKEKVFFIFAKYNMFMALQIITRGYVAWRKWRKV